MLFSKCIHFCGVSCGFSCCFIDTAVVGDVRRAKHKQKALIASGAIGVPCSVPCSFIRIRTASYRRPNWLTHCWLPQCVPENDIWLLTQCLYLQAHLAALQFHVIGSSLTSKMHIRHLALAVSAHVLTKQSAKDACLGITDALASAIADSRQRYANSWGACTCRALNVLQNETRLYKFAVE